MNEIKHEWKQVGIIDLDWSGPEPTSVEDLGNLVALLPPNEPGTRYLAKCEQRYVEWVLPRSYTIIGNLPLVPSGHLVPGGSGGAGWRVGESLWRLRLWSAGVRKRPEDPRSLSVRGAAFRDLPGRSRNSSILSLCVFDGGDVDVEQLVALFPDLEELYIDGSLDTLVNPRAIARLTQLASSACTTSSA